MAAGANLVWKIGDVSITRVVESCNPIAPTGLFPDATAEAVARHASWLAPHFLTPGGDFLLSIHALVVEAGGQRILVDTCIGEHPLPGYEALTAGPRTFLDDLAAAGFARETIDVVLCTHLHFDHVGWNTMNVDGRWVPTFPNARYLFAREEWEHWKGLGGGDFAATLDDAVRPVIDAGLADLVETDHRINDEVRLESTPGHTPGHVAVRIDSAGKRAMITGDLSHHPIQWAEPDWPMSADSDSAQAARTRRRLIGEHADADLLVIGTHYAPPCAGHLVSRGGICVLETDD